MFTLIFISDIIIKVFECKGVFMSKFKIWLQGVKNGFPIFLGYFAVSFTLGIAAKNIGMSGFEAALMSATNLTSAGEFAALAIIASSSGYIEMALTELIINLRYALMSSALSQKIKPETSVFHRLLIAFGNTDEIFAVATSKKGYISPYYCYGLTFLPLLGWTFGTLLGVISGSLLPPRVISALSVALYGMFIAIIVPPARKNKVIMGIILVSMALSAVFTYAPILKLIPSGFRIIILTVLIAGASAYFFPINEKEEVK